jgi:hypothetical protein
VTLDNLMSRRLTYSAVVSLIVLVTGLGGERVMDYRGLRSTRALEATEE